MTETCQIVSSIRAEFGPLVDCLRDAASGPLDWWPNTGNWGDGLIRYGTIEFFRHHEIPFRQVSDSRSPESQTLLYGGGGAWCRTFPTAKERVAEALSRYERIIVLPSTIDLDVSGLDPGRVTIFSRDDQSSFRHEVHAVVPDLAFWIDVEPHPEGAGTLACLTKAKGRNRIGHQVPGSIDLSRAGDHLSPPEPFFAALRPCERIITDRLHVAIAGAMLGKRVDLLEGDYWKCRAVYETSLHRFPRVKMRHWNELRSLLASEE